MKPALCLAPDVLDMMPLTVHAWTKVEEMSVLADLLFERSFVVAKPHGYEHHEAKDGALYEVECAVREWILDMFHPGHELRVTGGWPDIVYVVYKNDLEKETTTLGERVEILPGVLKQPRLLRSATLERRTS